MSTVSKPPNASICRLCSGNAELKLSHIFPRFAVKYLKESSSTGYLRGLASGKRSQETRRVYLLCENCEQLLSAGEKIFCEQIFLPLHKENKNSFPYDKWLIRFLVGLHWRVLVSKTDTYPDDAEAAYATVEPEWRAYLLGQRPDYGTSEFHVFLADVVEDASSAVSQKLNWYLARGLDGTPTFSEAGQFGCYVKLLRVMSYAFITPRDPEQEKWVGTQIGEQGTLAGPQTINTQSFWPLVDSRVRALEAAPSGMTARQRQKFEEAAMRDPEKFLNSESTRVVLANRQLERRMAAKHKGPVAMKGRDRNQPCPCGSGKKQKKCCGMFTHDRDL
jgi:SEC-C motif